MVMWSTTLIWREDINWKTKKVFWKNLFSLLIDSLPMHNALLSGTTIMRYCHALLSFTVNWLYDFRLVLFIYLFIYLIFKAVLQLSIKCKILELEIYTNIIVKYNNYIYTRKTWRTIRSKDEDLHINKVYIIAIYKDYLVITTVLFYQLEH